MKMELPILHLEGEINMDSFLYKKHKQRVRYKMHSHDNEVQLHGFGGLIHSPPRIMQIRLP